VPKAPWSAAAKLPPWNTGKKAAAWLPHSKALRAFSWFQAARQPTGHERLLKRLAIFELPRAAGQNPEIQTLEELPLIGAGSQQRGGVELYVLDRLLCGFVKLHPALAQLRHLDAFARNPHGAKQKFAHDAFSLVNDRVIQRAPALEGIQVNGSFVLARGAGIELLIALEAFRRLRHVPERVVEQRQPPLGLRVRRQGLLSCLLFGDGMVVARVVQVTSSQGVVLADVPSQVAR